MAIDASIDSYILESLTRLDNNSISVDDLVNELCAKLKSSYNIDDNSEIRQTLINIVYSYKNKAISSSYFLELFKEVIAINAPEQITEITDEVTDSESSGVTYTSSGGSSGGSSGSATSQIEVDVIPDIIIAAAEKLTGVEGKVDGVSLAVPGEVAADDKTKINTAVDGAKTEVKTGLAEVKEAMDTALKKIIEIDEDITPFELENMDFEQIKDTVANLNAKSLAVKATEEFFRNCPDCTVTDGIATVMIDGKKYEYNLKKRRLYIDGVDATGSDIDFYVPSVASDYSKLNTYTCFIKKHDASVEETMGKQYTNAVIARITKPGDQQNYDRYDETAEVTKFLNKIAGTDRTKCKNIIAGDSAYGSHALQITARHPEMYDTVYCINNALIVEGQNGHGSKQRFASLDDLSGLNGKDIYFISCSGDDNFSHNNGWQHTSDYTQGYTYTGIKLLCENTTARVHVVYNERDVTNRTDSLPGILSALCDSYANCTYEPDLFFTFFDEAMYCRDHSKGIYGVSQAAKSTITNVNGYSISDTGETA